MLIGRENISAEQARKSIWMTVYGDIVTNLLLFFLVLYASTRFTAEETAKVISGMETTFVSQGEKKERAKGQAAAAQTRTAIRKLAEQLKAMGITIKEDGDGITLILPDAGFFESGKADLTPEMKKILAAIAPPLRTYPDTIILEGHTDDRRILQPSPFLSNWELSFARVQTVLRYLTREERLPPSRMIAIGRGAYRPVAPNDTPENRRKNRRTEIKLRALEVAP